MMSKCETDQDLVAKVAAGKEKRSVWDGQGFCQFPCCTLL